MKKSLFLFLTVALSSAAVFAGDKAPAAAPAPKTDDPVVLTIGDMNVSKSELDSVIASLPQEYQMMIQQQGKRAFADEYVRMKLLAREAEAVKLDKDPKVAAQLGLVRENLMASAMIGKMEQGIIPTDEQIAALYESKKPELETVEARHILIAFKGSPAAKPDTELTEEQAKTKAEELRNKVLAGADFAELAKTESHDTFSGEKGGSLGSFGRGQMVPEFDQAAFGTEVGKTSEVFRTAYGFHFLQVMKRGFQQMDELREQLTGEVKQKMLQAKLAEMASKVKVTMDDAYFGPVAPSMESAAPAGETGAH